MSISAVLWDDRSILKDRATIPILARTYTHGANYNLPPARQAGDNRNHNLDYKYADLENSASTTHLASIS